MKILFIAPVHKEYEFLNQKGGKPFLESQGQQCIYDALKKLGHEVFVFRYSDTYLIPNKIRIPIKEFFIHFFPSFYHKVNRFNDKFYKLIPENFVKNKKLYGLSIKTKPELIIISGGFSQIFPANLLNIKNKLSPKIILLGGVNPTTSSPDAEREIVVKKTVDIVVENDRHYKELWEKLGAKKVIVLPISSIDPSLHRKVKLNKKEQQLYNSDVCFVGTLTSNRQIILSSLTNFNLKIFGDIPAGLTLDDELKHFYYGEAWGEKMVKIFNCAKIVLNIQPPDMTYGGNMRTFEIPGCGAFQLVDRYSNEWFVEGKEIASFRNVGDLKRKISFFLKNDKIRRSIANAGYNKSHKEHTYEKHFKKLLSKI